jgi:hypothetical protein
MVTFVKSMDFMHSQKTFKSLSQRTSCSLALFGTATSWSRFGHVEGTVLYLAYPNMYDHDQPREYKLVLNNGEQRMTEIVLFELLYDQKSCFSSSFRGMDRLGG